MCFLVLRFISLVITKQKAGNLRPHMEKPLRTCVLFLELSEKPGYGQSETDLKQIASYIYGRMIFKWEREVFQQMVLAQLDIDWDINKH